MMDTKINFVPLPGGVAHPGPRRIAVASGKGGVGKTWFAITLAHALAEAGTSVLLFDGDLGLANIDIQLGLTPQTDLSAVLSGRLTLAQAAIRFTPGGFDILAGRSGSGALSSLAPARLDALLADLCQVPHQILLVDLGAGLDWATRHMAAWADTLLVLANDEPTSLTDAYAVLKLYATDRGDAVRDARVVINQVPAKAAGERIYATLAKACQNFLGAAPKLAGVVRRDEHVRDAIRRQMPLLTRHPTTNAATDVRAIAQHFQMQ